MPPDPALLRVVRLVASGLTSLTDLDVDGVEGVRAGVDELVSTLIEASDGTWIVMGLELHDRRLVVSATTHSRSRTFGPSPTTERILDGVATDHRWHAEGSTVVGTVVYEL